jgi:hypothetical protein
VRLHQRIHQAVVADLDGDPRAVAETLFDTLDREEWIMLLAEEVAGEQRAETHRLERSAFKLVHRVRTPRTMEVRQHERADFAVLMNRPFKLGTGGEVVWKRATADQHRQRAAFLRRQAAGTIRTAERHEEAATLIETAGVECLADLTEAA